MKAQINKLKLIGKSTENGKPEKTSADRDSDIVALINGLSQTVFEINSSGELVYINTEWEKLCGFSIGESLGSDYIQYVHPYDREQCAQFFNNILNNNKDSSSVRLRMLTKTDDLCWVNLRANSFVNYNDNNLYIVGVLSNITDRVREYGLHQANFRTLYELINNLCGLVYRGRNDREWTMEFVSDGCLELTGYKPKDLENKTVTFGSLINPNDQDLVWNNVQSALAEKRYYDINYRIRTSTGTEKWVWERGKGNFSTTGELLSIEGLIVDITDYKRNKIEKNESHLYKTISRLPQKILFIDRLDLAVNKTKTIKSYKFAFMILSLDKYSKLQERYPADRIDKLNIAVSNIFKQAINSYDSLCMYDTGEFAFLLEHVESINDVTSIIKTIQKNMLEPVVINNIQTYLTFSIGVTLIDEPAIERKNVIEQAYSALSHAKSLGGSRYEIFNEELNAKMFALDRMENEVLYALDNDEFLGCYQPVIAIKDGTVIGMETQLYWKHPRRGKIPASAFSPIETNIELITSLNKWILSRTLKQIDTWSKDEDFNRQLQIIIHLCGHRIFSPELVNYMKDVLEKATLDKFRLMIRFDASFVPLLEADDIASIGKLKEQGLELVIAMDNSGIIPGSDLFSITADTVILEKPADTESLLHTKARIDFIHALNKKVILNDINTKDELDLVQKLEFDYIKGKAVVPPLNRDDIAEYLLRNRPETA